MKELQKDRRDFIKFSTLGILGLTLGAGVVISPLALQAQMKLRPPGAVSEKEFLALQKDSNKFICKYCCLCGF